MLEDVEEIAGMFERATRVFSMPIDPAAWGGLTPAEQAIVERAVDKRRSEFASGRVLARHALARLGVPAVELLQDAKRAPRWPASVAGSISHCGTRAFAAVAHRGDRETLGIDAEDLQVLTTDVWPALFTSHELQELRQADAAIRNTQALIVFSAKESLYKAQYPRTGAFVDFSDVRVELAATGTFHCIFENAVGGFRVGAVIPGRFRILAPWNLVLTAVSISDQQMC